MAWTKEQELAINESGQNIIVSAGAGSGKTAVLTARTMRLLDNGVHINEMLILTFTKAAAGEMKERIRKKIKEGVKNNSNLAKELELVDQAYITTFDSFSLSVVKKYHYLINISKDIEISDSSIIDLNKKRILDEVMDFYYENPTEGFRRLVYDYCVKDDEGLKKEILGIADKIDSMSDRDNYLANYKNNYFTEDFYNNCMEEYEEIIKGLKLDIKSKEKKLHYYVEGDYEERVRGVLENIHKADNLDGLLTILNSIRLPNLPKGSSDEAKRYKDELKKAIDTLKETVNIYGNEDEIKKGVESSKEYVLTIIEIIKEYLNRLHLFKRENEIYDFQDIALLSIDILKNNMMVREELKKSFKQIMIDEYQDTNDIQESFISMIENNNVYMVGDIKQSIYRFRNANPYIFRNKYDSYADSNGGLKIDLLKNFRSREEVLNNINEIFNFLMDNAIGGAEYYESHRMVFGNLSYEEEGKTEQNYNMELLEYSYDKNSKYTKEEIEIFSIAEDIISKVNSKYKVFDKDEKVLRDITYSDFVILMDRTTDFDLYKKIFEYKGIPLTLFKDDKLNNSYDIYILKNIIDMLIKINRNELDQQFKYDFISVARSYLYDISDAEIFESFKNNSFKETDIYKDFRIIANNINHLSIREIIDNDSVKIMTIHKSKGLEYHICYFSGLYKKFNISDLKARFMFDNKYGIISPYFENGIKDTMYKYLVKYNYLEEEVSEKIRLFYVALTRAKEKMIMLVPNAVEIEEFLEDNGTIELGVRRKYQSMADMLNSIKSKIIKYYREIDVDNLNISRDYLYKISRSYEENSIYDNEFSVKEINVDEPLLLENKHFSKSTIGLIDKNTKDNLRFGEKLHAILEFLDFTNPEYDLIEDRIMIGKVEKFINNPLFNNFKNVKIYKEYEFMYEEGKNSYHGIIDLLLEYEDKICIVDYKLSNIEEEKYKEQLKGYKKYVSTISDKPIYTYLYSILGEKVEEV